MSSATPGRPARRDRLAARLMLAQVLVIASGAVTLLVTAVLVAPALFSNHLARAGVDDPEAVGHAEEAFADAFGVALAVGSLMSLTAAGLVSWFLVRRLSRPIEQLAVAADAIAAGGSSVTVPDEGFSAEMRQLSSSFAGMAHQLADVDASRARMLADLSHELRTPLATLQAYLQGMQDGVVPLTEESWTTAQEQIDRLRRLSTDVRDVAQAQEHALDLDPQPVDVRDLAASAVALVEPRASSREVSIDLQLEDRPCIAVVDRDRMGQVLANLLDNAIRHTPHAGRVDVVVSGRPDATTVTVSDTGEGIAPGELDAIFERFHRSDTSRTRDGSGSGLGLTIARAIVADHGGRLDATSPGHGRGACFTVTLPARQAATTLQRTFIK